VTVSLLNFSYYEINGRFVPNLEPKFKIECGRVKECKTRHAVEKQLKNGSNPSARCVF